MKTLSWLRHLAVLLCLGLVCGCGAKNDRVLGKAPQGGPRKVCLVLGGEAPAQVVMRGTMIEKCPVAGCWFRLQDPSGTIKVDTKAAGFVVSRIPVGATVTVGGKPGWDGSETVLKATGVSY